jgi:hypothetical protein
MGVRDRIFAYEKSSGPFGRVPGRRMLGWTSPSNISFEESSLSSIWCTERLRGVPERMDRLERFVAPEGLLVLVSSRNRR